MIPPITDKRWELLLKGKIKHNFKILSASLMLSRLSRKLKKENNPLLIKECVQEIYNFFIKFEKILSDDLKAIFK